MKILIVTETLHEGGAEIFILRLARKLLHEGVNVDVLSLNGDEENTKLTALFPELNIHRLYLPLRRAVDIADRFLLKMKIPFSIRYSIQSRQVRKKFISQYDIIHTHAIQVDYLFAKQKTNKSSFRHVVTLHGDYLDHFERTRKNEGVIWLNILSWLSVLNQKVDHFVVISEHQKAFLLNDLKWKEDKISHIYNGFDLIFPIHDIQPLEKMDHFIMGMAARGIPEKGWELLIKAFLRMTPDCQLVLLGDSDYLRQLKMKYRHDRILFAGFQVNPPEWIRYFNVFVLPTYYAAESLPSVVIEALYCHKPVIATAIGEIPKMLEVPNSGLKAGFLIEREQLDEEGLLTLLNKVYRERDELKMLNDLAGKAFEKFDMERCMRSYLELYGAVVN